MTCRGVAKFGIALGSGPRGLGFESRHSDHKKHRNRRVHVHRYTMWPMGQTGRYRARKISRGNFPRLIFFFDPKYICASHFNWMRRLDTGYNIELNLSPLPFHWQRAVFCLTVIEHPLIALSPDSNRYHLQQAIIVPCISLPRYSKAIVVSLGGFSSSQLKR